jgi:hypothetical protein
MIKRKRTKGQTTIQKETIEQLQDHERQIIAILAGWHPLKPSIVVLR